MIDLIIPTYNNEETIGRALASIVAQTRPRKFLVTVVDDCSTDSTAAVVKKFKGLLPLNYIKLEENLGKPGLVRNVGIKRTNCPYIVFLDADDMLAPIAAEVLSRAILQNKPDFINSAFYQDNRTDEYNIIDTRALTWLHGNAYSRKFLEDNNIMFDDKFNEDGSFNLRCAWMSNNKYTIDQPLCYWMDNRESITRKNKNFMEDIAEDYIVTYTNAILHILLYNNELAKDKEFSLVCANKLAEFIQFYDTILYRKREELITDVRFGIIKYIAVLQSFDMINKDFLNLTNRHFNRYNIFIDTVRQNTLMDYLQSFNIEWSDYVNE